MKINADVTVAGSPQFNVNAKSGPLALEMAGECSFSVITEEIIARIDRIPVLVTIPFLKRGGGVVAVGAIGPFRGRLEPVKASAQAFGVRFDGVLGKDGINCDIAGSASCKGDVHIDATIPAEVTKTIVRELIKD